ncbi:MAG: cob(I)yrinic acid a,c-diamide adenosyltransferase [Firmicutes bacterium]|nr:cob(I)yrinic acid a,c-diamide adenosyltransferase [Bacillota bacterium]
MDRRGLVLVYTGDGKGKTTAAMGLVLRAAGHDHRVLVVQFMKGQKTGEVEALRRFLPQVDVLQCGRDVFVDADNPDEIDIRLARDAFERVRLATSRGDYDLVILDELNVAVDYGLIPENAVLEMIEARDPSVSLVLTGRGASPKIQDVADLVSEVKEIKHHWRQGIPAQAGIEH